ncbi:Dynein light chain Tctex-type [Schizosaccharomyces pombe]|uniref:Dynein light chain Tctex-type n=1 Tax=Schizosaccharomyces pombe (strain 972 / ATCC 24843) TaxID=284812 RepID=DYLT_SCHPO|nr:dynein light chain Dlc1 [Schizosaccharomyces pombe]Q9UTS6.1 RecName: Full=Dynein light chain Tctex-type; AltName: Full=TCTEX-1 protein homolog [Schizosaccharomyces pombe 972h-]AAF09243.1 cytoplasmic dynein light chain Dlc1 [Schizosaccharomyces pombe]CAD99133.1 dynein light chain Dlc1 [Schizosaccharomyces pombe]|eukprot:NP_001018252.1 dynein light chain Dlc1 [Schizosaccharomyces pombe]
MSCPIDSKKLEEICLEAAQPVLKASEYDGDKTAEMNQSVIYAVLNALNKETQSYKWIVSSTLVQKLPEDHPSRGVHAAHAACWNCEKDGMTTIKESGEAIDVVLSIMWISI